jgi:hypothetical protein
MDSKDRPQDEYLDGRDMLFHGYQIETLEQGGEYPDTMPQAIEVTDTEGRKALYIPLSEDRKLVHSSPTIEALKMRCAPRPILNWQACCYWEPKLTLMDARK